MDTKLKKYKNDRGLKLVLFLLCVGSFLGSIISGFVGIERMGMSGFSSFGDVMENMPYETTSLFLNEINDKIYGISEMAAIEKVLSENEKNGSVSMELMVYFDDLFHLSDAGTAAEGAPTEEGAEEAEKRMVLSEDDIAILKSQYEFRKNQMETEKGVFYYYKDGDLAISNESGILKESLVQVKSKLEDYPAFYQYEKGIVKIQPDFTDYHFGVELPFGFANSILYLGFSQNYLDAGQNLLEQKSAMARAPFLVAAVLAMLTILLFVTLMILTGKRDEEGNPVLNFVDRIYTEVQLALIGLFFIGGGALFLMLIYGIFGNRLYMDNGIQWMDSEPWFLFLCFLVGVPSAVCGLELILSVVRNLKYKRFIRNSFLYRFKNLIVAGLLKLWRGLIKFCEPLKESVQEFIRGGTVMRKVLLLAGGLILLTSFVYMFFFMLLGLQSYGWFECLFATCLMMFIALGIGSRFIQPHVRQYEEIKTGLKKVKGGELSYQIPVYSQSELGELAANINNISEGFDVAVQNEMKNQRLKTELISNVSHDIKTPLTSIITYVDLLKNEGLDSPNAPEYLDILEQKSFRLKKLTEDLFDAAKASSGAIKIHLEEVELLSLINQGLGEMNSKIEKAGLIFKINAEKDRYYVTADGQLLWRVVENLLSNIIKYAQEHTRVYVDVRDEENTVIMEFKNISRMELNIPEEELMERFKRGDESRTTEGSGLGLAIARDLVRTQNGEFSLKIDGDLFKAIVELPKSRKISS